MAKNFVRTHLKWLSSIILSGLCLAGVLAFSSPVYGATIFEDNFDAYDLGGLDDQGDWHDLMTGYHNVNDTKFFGTSGQSVRCSGTQCGSFKFGADTPSGTLSIQVNLPEAGSETTSDLTLIFRDNQQFKFQLKLEVYYDHYEEGAFIQLYLYDPSIPAYVPSGVPVAWSDTWHEVVVEWQYLTQNYRAKFNGLWSVWSAPISSWVDISEIRVASIVISAGAVYFDEIQEAGSCGIGNCDLCETYTACSDGDCSWYYSIFLQEYYCVEPFETDPEECGAFYQCQFCTTQELCEGETGFCEWQDLGSGNQCYMLEPETPLPQEEWQVPDLEDCQALAGVEKWLCEIKNDLLGVFMPSQTKITALYQTIGSFKEKFPFNYASSLQLFFKEIEDSIDEEKPIPIKILGNEANVSFDFWEQETVIGGVAESFKNVLFDFSTLIILIAFLVWLLSLIKRFF